MSGNVFFLFDYRKFVGAGHVKRSSNLASFMKSKTCFNIKFVKHHNFGPTDHLDMDFDWVGFDQSLNSDTTLVIDAINSFIDEAWLVGIVQTCQNYDVKVILINGTGPYDWAEKVGLKESDVNIEPFYDQNKRKDTGYLSLSTFSYNLVPQKFYLNVWKDKGQNNLLFLSGNSDPYSSSVHLLNLLSNQITDKFLNIDVVIGSEFSPNLKSQLKELAMQNEKIILHEKVTCIIDKVLSSKLVVSADGLTKFELAVMGAPTLFYSMDSSGEEADLEFRKLEYGNHLGIYKNINQQSFTSQLLNELRMDNSDRYELIRRKYFAKFGMQLLVDKIWG